MDTAVNLTRKRSRIVIVIVVMSIVLLAGAAFQWGKPSFAPDVTIRCGSTGVVHHMTPVDARATREILEQRDQRELWLKWGIHCACFADYEICFDNQIFAVHHDGGGGPKGSCPHIEYYTVDSDGEYHLVTSYFIVPYRDITFFHKLFLKYKERDQGTAPAPTG